MRRPVYITAFLLLIVSLPLYAQHGGGHGSFGGGHASGGGHSGFSAHSGFSGHSGGGHASMGMHAGGGFGSRASARGSSFNRSFSGRGFNHFRDRDRDRFRFGSFRNNCFGFGCGWGFGSPYLWGGIDPYWWWEGSSYDQDQQNQIDMANQMNAQSLEEQRMRQQDDPPGDQNAYARSAPPPQRQPDTQAAPATVLIFRDQHKQEVQNYAIVGQTLWTFAPQHNQKIPLSDLDLPATTKANEERGVDFRVPGSNEGQ